MAGKDFVQKVDIESGSLQELLFRGIQLAIAPIHPFGKGDLSSIGISYSPEVTTTDGTITEVEAVTIDFGVEEDIIEVEFSLTLRLKSTGATKDALFKWRARNKGGTWVDLHTTVTYAANASTYKEYTMSGRFVTVANFDKIPFEVQAVIQREDATENVTAQVKSTSYILILI